ncbi:MAG: FecR domain-containing protein [Sphingomonas sp.]|uniref:FecR family protein n=1 Tax=Sphingomonas sp. TaxID=28214 RepID=UPI0035628A5F
MALPDPSNSIDDQAAHWAVEAAYSDMSPESRAELDAWLAADPRHRGAFARVRAALHVMEQAVVDAHSAPVPSTPGRSVSISDNDNDVAASHDEVAPDPLRRGFSRWGGRAAAGAAALAASVAALVMVGVPALAPFRPAGIAAAEKVVLLRDGSVATLRHDATLEVALSPNFRKVTLLSGEALFKVAKDKSRPFVVRSGDVYAQATGTVYSVTRVGPTGGTVKVTEGSVLVWSRDERDQAVLLHAGDAVTLDLGPIEPPASREMAPPSLPPPELAQISLDNVPIKSAIVRFNRVNSTKIVITDPAIGDIRIVGLFRANDVEQFAQAAAALSGGKVAHEKGRIEIKKK